ncbi:MAG: XTP/dITP diphosphatase [Candidatus Thermoplasmatota archaeon]
MKTIFFITSNPGKVAEASAKCKECGLRVLQKDFGYPEIQADSLEEVARFGVEYVRKKFNEPFILEDAGLFIHSLNEFPGVYSKYVFLTIGLSGVLKLLETSSDRSAVFRSVVAFSSPLIDPVFFTGETLGTITSYARGTFGFGYDPIFIPNGHTKTFAEMDSTEKNIYSHRAQALDKFLRYIQEHQKLLDSV